MQERRWLLITAGWVASMVFTIGAPLLFAQMGGAAALEALELNCDGKYEELKKLAVGAGATLECDYSVGNELIKTKVLFGCNINGEDKSSIYEVRKGAIFWGEGDVTGHGVAELYTVTRIEDTLRIKLQDFSAFGDKGKIQGKVHLALGSRHSYLFEDMLFCVADEWARIGEKRREVSRPFMQQTPNLHEQRKALDGIAGICRDFHRWSRFRHPVGYDLQLRGHIETLGKYLTHVEGAYADDVSIVEVAVNNARSCLGSLEESNEERIRSSVADDKFDQEDAFASPRNSVLVEDVGVLGKVSGWGDEIKINRSDSDKIPLEVFMQKMLFGEPGNHLIEFNGIVYEFADYLLTPAGAFAAATSASDYIYEQPWRYCYHPQGKHMHEKEHNLKKQIRYFPEAHYDASDEAFEIHVISNRHEHELIHWIYIPGRREGNPYLLFEIIGLSQSELAGCGRGPYGLRGVEGGLPEIEAEIREATLPEKEMYSKSHNDKMRLYIKFKPSLDDLRLLIRDFGGRAIYGVECNAKRQKVAPRRNPPVGSVPTSFGSRTSGFFVSDGGHDLVWHYSGRNANQFADGRFEVEIYFHDFGSRKLSVVPRPASENRPPPYDQMPVLDLHEVQIRGVPFSPRRSSALAVKFEFSKDQVGHIFRISEEGGYLDLYLPEFDISRDGSKIKVEASTLLDQSLPVYFSRVDEGEHEIIKRLQVAEFLDPPAEAQYVVGPYHFPCVLKSEWEVEVDGMERPGMAWGLQSTGTSSFSIDDFEAVRKTEVVIVRQADNSRFTLDVVLRERPRVAKIWTAPYATSPKDPPFVIRDGEVSLQAEELRRLEGSRQFKIVANLYKTSSVDVVLPLLVVGVGLAALVVFMRRKKRGRVKAGSSPTDSKEIEGKKKAGNFEEGSESSFQHQFRVKRGSTGDTSAGPSEGDPQGEGRSGAPVASPSDSGSSSDEDKATTFVTSPVVTEGVPKELPTPGTGTPSPALPPSPSPAEPSVEKGAREDDDPDRSREASRRDESERVRAETERNEFRAEAEEARENDDPGRSREASRRDESERVHAESERNEFRAEAEKAREDDDSDRSMETPRRDESERVRAKSERKKFRAEAEEVREDDDSDRSRGALRRDESEREQAESETEELLAEAEVAKRLLAEAKKVKAEAEEARRVIAEAKDYQRYKSRRDRYLEEARVVSAGHGARPRLVSTFDQQRFAAEKFWPPLHERLESYRLQLEELRSPSSGGQVNLIDQEIVPPRRSLRDALDLLNEEMLDALPRLESLYEAWAGCEEENRRIELELEMDTPTVDLSKLAEERAADRWQSQLAVFLFRYILDRMPHLFPMHQLLSEGLERELPDLYPAVKSRVNDLDATMKKVRKTLKNLRILPMELKLYTDYTQLEKDHKGVHFAPKPLPDGLIKERLADLGFADGVVARYDGWVFRNSITDSWLNNSLSLWLHFEERGKGD